MADGATIAAPAEPMAVAATTAPARHACAIPWREDGGGALDETAAPSRSSADDVTIREGDLVVLYERHDSMRAVRVARGGVAQNRYGCFDHNDWIGKPFGSVVRDRAGRNWVVLLKPTAELWTKVLPHRTQILYVADISAVVTFLELRPGSSVIESGTGSGSLTHALARAVAPHGRVHTFEFHAGRADRARQEFEAHGLASIVTTTERDVEANGFPADALEGSVDAAFLDLPGPWRAVDSATRCLRTGGTLCSFSPCIEQVQKTCQRLGESLYHRVRTMEIILKPYEVRYQPRDPCFISSDGDAATAAAAPVDANGKEGGGGGERARGRVARDEDAFPVASQDVRGHTGYLTFATKTNLCPL